MTKLNRFNGWVSVLASSCVVIGSLIQDPEINETRNSNDKYVIATCCIAIALSILSIIGYLCTDKLVGGIFEAALGTTVCALWCGAISLIMNPRNQLAIRQEGLSHVVRNTNLYFFTWAAFISSAFVLASIAQQYRLVDVQHASSKIVRWYLFLVASVVVFGTATKLRAVTCLVPEDDICRTTNYAVSLGVISAGLSVIPITWFHCAKMSLIVEAIVGTILMVFYSVGAAYITDISGPGSNIGNLYFSTWIGFGISVLLTFSCFKEMITPESAVEESQHPDVSKTGAQQEEGEQQGQSTGPQGAGQGDLEDVDVDEDRRDEEA